MSTKPKGFGPIPQKKQRSGRSQEWEVQGSCGLGHPAGLGTRGVQAGVDKGPVHRQTIHSCSEPLKYRLSRPHGAKCSKLPAL